MSSAIHRAGAKETAEASRRRSKLLVDHYQMSTTSDWGWENTVFWGRRIFTGGRSLEEAWAFFRERSEMATKSFKWTNDKEIKDGKWPSPRASLEEINPEEESRSFQGCGQERRETKPGQGQDKWVQTTAALPGDCSPPGNRMIPEVHRPSDLKTAIYLPCVGTESGVPSPQPALCGNWVRSTIPTTLSWSPIAGKVQLLGLYRRPVNTCWWAY